MTKIIAFFIASASAATVNTASNVINVPAGADLNPIIEAAEKFSVLVLEPGTYPVSQTIEISKSITIKCSNSEQRAVLDAGRQTRVMKVTGGEVVLKHIEIKSGYMEGMGPGLGAGVWINGGDVDMIECNIHDNVANGHGAGVYVHKGRATIVSCSISDHVDLLPVDANPNWADIEKGAFVRFKGSNYFNGKMSVKHSPDQEMGYHYMYGR